MPYYPRIKKHRIVRSGPVQGTYRLGNREKWLQNDGTRFGLTWLAGQQGLVAANAATAYSVDCNFELLGTDAVSGTVAYDPEGGLTFTTDADANDSMICLPHLTAGLSPWTGFKWSSDREPHWECLIKTAAAITNATIWAGLKMSNTPVIATDADQAFFRYQAGVNSGAWYTVSSIGDSDTSTVSKVIVAVSTQYHLAIEVDSARRARFFIDGKLIYTTAPLTDTLDTLEPYIGILTSTGARTVSIYGQAISRLYGA